MAMGQQQDRRAVLKALDDSPWKTRVSDPKQNGFSRWRGDEAARAGARTSTSDTCFTSPATISR